MFMPQSMPGASPPGMGGFPMANMAMPEQVSGPGGMPMGGLLGLMAGGSGMPIGVIPQMMMSRGNLFDTGLARGLSPIRPPQPGQFPTPPVTYSPLPGGNPVSSMPGAPNMTPPAMSPGTFGPMNPQMFGGGNPFAAPGMFPTSRSARTAPHLPYNVGTI